ncbi:MAG: hypothetical protein PHN60_04325 [Candidatus Gracilibacteria bacterium]|nr:hypothetical protein [Candidatus Gracilibacteria bacterium]
MFDEIREVKEVLLYLEKRGLVLSYQKAKKGLLSGNTHGLDFKMRQPKKYEIFQFRLTGKYRAFASIKNHDGKKVLVIHKISDHQDS